MPRGSFYIFLMESVSYEYIAWLFSSHLFILIINNNTFIVTSSNRKNASQQIVSN